MRSRGFESLRILRVSALWSLLCSLSLHARLCSTRFCFTRLCSILARCFFTLRRSPAHRWLLRQPAALRRRCAGRNPLYPSVLRVRSVRNAGSRGSADRPCGVGVCPQRAQHGSEFAGPDCARADSVEWIRPCDPTVNPTVIAAGESVPATPAVQPSSRPAVHPFIRSSALL